MRSSWNNRKARYKSSKWYFIIKETKRREDRTFKNFSLLVAFLVYRFLPFGKEEENFDQFDCQDDRRIRLSLFGQSLQSLRDSFYSTILEDSNRKEEEKEIIKSSDQLKQCQLNDLTFDQCSFNEIATKDNFSFTFHSVDQSNSISNVSHSTAQQVASSILVFRLFERFSSV